MKTKTRKVLIEINDDLWQYGKMYASLHGTTRTQMIRDLFAAVRDPKRFELTLALSKGRDGEGDIV